MPLVTIATIQTDEGPIVFSVNQQANGRINALQCDNPASLSAYGAYEDPDTPGVLIGRTFPPGTTTQSIPPKQFRVNGVELEVRKDDGTWVALGTDIRYPAA